MAERHEMKLDIEKVEAALKRAAHRALHGTREERSGRFLHKEKLATSKVRDGSSSPRGKDNEAP